MKFAERTSWPSEPNPLSSAIERERAWGRRVLDLTLTNPTECGFGHAAELLAPLSDPRNLKYDPDPRGLREAREAVAGYYAARGVNVNPERIFLTSGTSEAYSFVFRLTGERGDAVLVPKPGYPLLDVLADLNDLRVTGYRLDRSAGWAIDRAQFADALAERRAAAIVAVHPNNPTGHYVSSADAAFIGEQAARGGACVISDEVFFDSASGPAPRASFAQGGPALAFTLSGLSKFAGLPQMKVAWIVLSGPVAPRAEAARRLEMIADAYLSVGTPPQRALASWLKAGEKLSAEIAARAARNRAALERAAAGSGAEVWPAESGWHALVRTPVPDEQAALGLLKDEGVLVQPGYLFDFDEDGVLALSLILPEAAFDEAVSRLFKWIRSR